MDPITRIRPTRRTESTPRHRRAPRLAAVTVATLAVAGLLAGACSSDDEGAASTTSTSADHGEHGEHASAPLLGDEVDADACEAFAELSAAMTGDPSAAGPALETMEATLPTALVPYGATVATAFESALAGDEAAMGSPEFVTAYEQIGSAMFDGCPATERLDVDGVDYGFEGLPTTVASGTVALRFTNRSSSSEMHEIIVMRRADGDDTDLETIATTPPDELMGSMEMVGLAFSDQPEASSTTFMELEPGSYVAICTIPVGGGETGDPHAAHGMIAEFDVA